MGDGVRDGIGVNTILHTSVATLYDNLVTRPTGRAVRVAIERQIQEAGGTCLSVLDFSQVRVVDFSCADEVIAKLLQKYRQADRPSEAFFVLKGVSEHQRDQIQTVLERHNLLTVAVEADGPAALWGRAPARLRWAWEHLGKLGRAEPRQFACGCGVSNLAAASWLRRLVAWRLAIPEGQGRFCSLPALLDGAHALPPQL